MSCLSQFTMFFSCLSFLSKVFPTASSLFFLFCTLRLGFLSKPHKHLASSLWISPLLKGISTYPRLSWSFPRPGPPGVTYFNNWHHHPSGWASSLMSSSLQLHTHLSPKPYRLASWMSWICTQPLPLSKGSPYKSPCTTAFASFSAAVIDGRVVFLICKSDYVTLQFKSTNCLSIL